MVENEGEMGKTMFEEGKSMSDEKYVAFGLRLNALWTNSKRILYGHGKRRQ